MATTQPFPTPLGAENPLGSLIYRGSTAGNIQSANDTNTYTLPLNAGQTITVDVATDASLQAYVNVTDPNGNFIATATGAAPGQEAVIQTAPVAITGTYTITVGGANSTTGSFEAKVTLNAALDSGQNQTLGAAQDLSGSAIGLTKLADRAAVVGHFDGNDHFYSFNLNAGQASSLALTLGSRALVTLYLEDGNGNVLATAVAGPQNVSFVIQDFVAQTAGSYYARLTGTGQSDYSMIITRSADFELEPTDQAHAQSLHVTHTVLGDIGNGVPTRDSDWYSFNVNAGDNLVLSTATPSDQGGQFQNNLFPEIALYDNNLNLVATNHNQPKNTPVDWTALSTGTYLAKVSDATGSGHKHSVGEYVLSIQGSTAP
jgi:hypothetical protein